MIDQNTKEVFDKAFDLMKQGVVAAADTLRTYAPQLWAMVKRQIIIEAFEYIVEAVFALLVSGLIIYFVRRGYKKRPNLNFDCFDQHDVNLTTVFLAAFGTIIAGILLVNAADMLFNPDYWTLRRVLELRQ